MNGEYDHEFAVLLDAVINEPHKVQAIVTGNRSILEATNRTGENALRWFSLENCFEQVRLLRSLGSSIQPEALSEAVGMGNAEMVGLLLELGAEPDLVSSSSELNSEFTNLSSRKKNIIKNHFRDYGYEL
jgi:ankyrin repeat protein